ARDTPERLGAVARGVRDALAAGRSGEGPDDLCDRAHVALAEGPVGGHRLAVVGRGAAELARALEAYVQGVAHPGLWRGQGPAATRGPVFVFSGFGSQWAGMGRRLLEEEPAFRASVEESDARFLEAGLGWSVAEMLSSGRAEPWQLEVSPAPIFVVQVALAALWRHWGVRPAAVLGHSTGEMAAAVVAGALTLEQGVRVCSRVGEAFERAQGRGHLVLVKLSASETRQALAELGSGACVAIENSPDSCLVGGPADEVGAAAAALEARGVVCQRTRILLPVHSPAFEPYGARLREALERAGLEPALAALPLYAASLGGRCRGDELGAAHWASNFGGLVRFEGAVERLLAEGHELFLEISPHPVVAPAVEQMLAARGSAGWALGSERRDADEPAAVRGALGELFAFGYLAELPGPRAEGATIVALPEATAVEGAIAPSATAGAGAASDGPPPLDRDAFGTLPGGRRLEALERYVLAHVAHALRVPAGGLSAQTPLRDLGCDSLLLTRLSSGIGAGVGLPLPPTLLWLQPTGAAVAAWLLERLAPVSDSRQAPARPAPRTEPPPRPAAPTVDAEVLRALSDDEAAALLLQTLQSIEVPRG
nr:acyltransferase domain-containing protein [Polyangiaceae bacterium]